MKHASPTPIRTTRLVLHPMTGEMADAALARDELAFEKIGFHTHGLWPFGDLCDALPFFIELLHDHEPDLFGPWVIVLQEEHTIIGDIGFKGPPDENGTIEIGFSIIASERQKGYCYEAADALIEQGRKHTSVQKIIAECLIRNTASARVLHKLHFAEVSRNDEYIKWELRRPTEG